MLEPVFRFRRIVLAPPGEAAGAAADPKAQASGDWGNPKVFAKTLASWNRHALLPWASLEHELLCAVRSGGHGGELGPDAPSRKACREQWVAPRGNR